MELYEKDALKSWGFSYAPNQVTEWQYHYSTMFRQWMDQAFRYMPQDLEERLNMQYMEAARTRIWISTAYHRERQSRCFFMTKPCVSPSSIRFGENCAHRGNLYGPVV